MYLVSLKNWLIQNNKQAQKETKNNKKSQNNWT